MTDYLVYDVFSEQPFGGNQLAVIPDARSLPESDLQKVAREFNYSETTFVYPPENPAHQAKVRIFTPTMEVPFAGHPVIGTVVALADLGAPGDMTLELGVGPLPCGITNGQAQFTTSASLEVMAMPDPTLIMQTLGLTANDIRLDTHAPTMATLGLPFTITEVASREALAKSVVDVNSMRIGATKHPASLDFAQFIYWRGEDALHARMFAPLDNIPEDPATGSACATLGALLAQLSAADQSLIILQGEDMGRTSKIRLQTRGEAVTIYGTAKRTMQGKLVY